MWIETRTLEEIAASDLARCREDMGVPVKAWAMMNIAEREAFTATLAHAA